MIVASQMSLIDRLSDKDTGLQIRDRANTAAVEIINNVSTPAKARNIQHRPNLSVCAEQSVDSNGIQRCRIEFGQSRMLPVATS